ncbi:hypothetical protein HQ545_04560 [Candidatus Woesearchaeota archaeon]|nr:hypothetical protein [Candidatus Woesearchaeota archaeon]
MVNNKTGTKTSTNRRNSIIAIALIVIIAALLATSLVLRKMEITGLQISTRDQLFYSQDASLTIATDQTIPWQVPEHPNKFQLRKISMDGEIIGDGQARIYLLANGEKYLVLDNRAINRQSNMITGNQVAESVNQESEEEPGEEQDEKPGEESDEEQDKNPNKESTEEKSIDLSLEYQKGTRWDADDDGRAYSRADAVDFTVENTGFSWNADGSKTCTKWTITSHEGIDTSICNGAEDCCGLIQLAPTSTNWDEPFYLYYQQHGSTLENTVTAQVIYLDQSLEPGNVRFDSAQSETKQLRAAFQEPDMNEFSDTCSQTCQLPEGLKDTDYELVFELEQGMTIKINTINYMLEVVEIEETQVQFNPEVADSNGIIVPTYIEFKDPDTNDVIATKRITKQKAKIKGERLVSPEQDNTITVLEGRYNIDVEIQEGQPVDSIHLQGAEISSDTREFITVDELSPRGESSMFSRVYSLGSGDVYFENATITTTSTGKDVFRCLAWNGGAQACEGKWEKIQGIEEGSSYTLPISSGTNSYAELDNTITVIDKESRLAKYDEKVSSAASGRMNVKLIMEGMEISINGYDTSRDNDLKIHEDTESDETRFSIDPSSMQFETMDITKVAKGDRLFKCISWNFDTQECEDSCSDEDEEIGLCTQTARWVEIKELTRGEEYTFTIDQKDPGFYEGSESSGESSTTSESYVNKVSQTFTAPKDGQYLVIASAEARTDTTSYKVAVRTTIDGDTISESKWEPNDADWYDDYQTYFTHKVVELEEGEHTLEMDYLLTENDCRAFIRNARISLIDLNEFQHSEEESEQIMGSSYQDITTLTFTPSIADEYLIIATGEYRAEKTDETIFAQLNMDSTEIDQARYEGKDAADYKTFAFHKVVRLNSEEHEIDIRGKSEYNNNGRIRRARITAIRLTPDFDAQTAESNDESNTKSESEVKTTLTIDPAEDGEYLILATAQIGGESKDNSVNAKLEIGGEGYADMRFKPKETSSPMDYTSFGTTQNIILDGDTYTAKITFGSSNNEKKAFIRNARITALRVTPAEGCVDNDEDGYNQEGLGCGTPDCDDDNDAINPGAQEICDNEIDDDCNGLTDLEDNSCGLCTDNDGDSFNQSFDYPTTCSECDGKMTSFTLQYLGSSSATIEVIQKKIDDPVFSGTVAPGGLFSFTGMDKKGTLGTVITIKVDDVENIQIHTSCSDILTNGMIIGDFRIIMGESLNGGALCPIIEFECGPEDCDDNNNTVYPGAQELCNNADDNCNELIDDGLTPDDCPIICEDLGYHWTGNGLELNCCGDDESENNPFETPLELTCDDNHDNDCNGFIDWEDNNCIQCIDEDEDGYNQSAEGCGVPDCDDTNASINPGATEICNGVDDNCDGTIDEGYDVDEDGYKHVMETAMTTTQAYTQEQQNYATT